MKQESSRQVWAIAGSYISARLLLRGYKFCKLKRLVAAGYTSAAATTAAFL